jgi:hypothetical protein
VLDKIFISPHPDDECLFGAYTIQREKPDLFVFRDRTAIWRCEETLAAMEWLELLQEKIHFIDTFDQLPNVKDVETVYAPAIQYGHPFHDAVCKHAILKYGPKVIFYATYGRNKSEPPFGRWKVDATERMKKRKIEALVYYESQRKITAIHFNLISKDEYYF